jgi:two-component system response regulator HupR/HoxA
MRNEISRAVALNDDLVIPAQAFSLRVLNGQTGLAGIHGLTDKSVTFPVSGTLNERLDAIEAMVLRETLLRNRWNKTKSAIELGLSRVGLRAKMVRFGLEGRL